MNKLPDTVVDYHRMLAKSDLSSMVIPVVPAYRVFVVGRVSIVGDKNVLAPFH